MTPFADRSYAASPIAPCATRLQAATGHRASGRTEAQARSAVAPDPWEVCGRVPPRSLVRFLAKLSTDYNRPLVLKSPPHTGRIRLLLELFPDARFVHIRRDPYTVFRSTRHMYATTMRFWQLQVPRVPRLRRPHPPHLPGDVRRLLRSAWTHPGGSVLRDQLRGPGGRPDRPGRGHLPSPRPGRLRVRPAPVAGLHRLDRRLPQESAPRIARGATAANLDGVASVLRGVGVRRPMNASPWRERMSDAAAQMERRGTGRRLRRAGRRMPTYGRETSTGTAASHTAPSPGWSSPATKRTAVSTCSTATGLGHASPTPTHDTAEAAVRQVESEYEGVAGKWTRPRLREGLDAPAIVMPPLPTAATRPLPGRQAEIVVVELQTAASLASVNVEGQHRPQSHPPGFRKSGASPHPNHRHGGGFAQGYPIWPWQAGQVVTSFLAIVRSFPRIADATYLPIKPAVVHRGFACHRLGLILRLTLPIRDDERKHDARRDDRPGEGKDEAQ